MALKDSNYRNCHKENVPDSQGKKIRRIWLNLRGIKITFLYDLSPPNKIIYVSIKAWDKANGDQRGKGAIPFYSVRQQGWDLRK